MNIPDLERIRFVTRYFHDLQGLRSAVPLGLLALGWGVGSSGFASWRAAALLVLGAFLLRLVAARYYRMFGEIEPAPVPGSAELYSISIFHRTGAAPWLHGFPLVTPGMRQLLVPMGTALGLFLFSLAVSPNIQTGSQLWPTLEEIGVFAPPLAGVWKPIEYEAIFAQSICLLSGSLFLGVWLRRERRSSTYLVFGAVLLVLATLGAFLGYLVGQETEEIVRIVNLVLPAVVHPWIALLLCGSSMILVGLLDHWQIVRTLGTPGSEDPD